MDKNFKRKLQDFGEGMVSWARSPAARDAVRSAIDREREREDEAEAEAAEAKRKQKREKAVEENQKLYGMKTGGVVKGYAKGGMVCAPASEPKRSYPKKK